MHAGNKTPKTNKNNNKENNNKNILEIGNKLVFKMDSNTMCGVFDQSTNANSDYTFWGKTFLRDDFYCFYFLMPDGKIYRKFPLNSLTLYNDVSNNSALTL